MSDLTSSIIPSDSKSSTDHLATSRLFEEKFHYSHPTTATPSHQTSPRLIYPSPSSSLRDSVKVMTSYDSNRALKQDHKDLDQQISSYEFQAWKKNFINEHNNTGNLTTSVISRYPELQRPSFKTHDTPNIPLTDSGSYRSSQIATSHREELGYQRTDARLSSSRLYGERYVSTSPHRDYLMKNNYNGPLTPKPAVSLRPSVTSDERYGFKSSELLNKGSYSTGKSLSYRSSVNPENEVISSNISRLDHLVSDIKNRNGKIGGSGYTTPIRKFSAAEQTTSLLGARSFDRSRENDSFLVKKSYPVVENYDSGLPPTFKPDLLAGFKDSPRFLGDQENRSQIERILSRYKREDVDPAPTVYQRKLIATPEPYLRSQPQSARLPSPQKVESISPAKISKEMSLRIAVGAIVLIILLVLCYCLFF